MGIPSWRQGPRGAAVPGDTGGWGAATRLHLVEAAPERRGRMEEQSLGDGPRETPGRGLTPAFSSGLPWSPRTCRGLHSL